MNETVSRLLAYLRPFEVDSSCSSCGHANRVPTAGKILSSGMANELLSVKDVDRDRIRLLARREVTAVLRRDRRTWVHTVREEFATYYPLADLTRTQLRHDMEPIRFWRYGTHRYLENRQRPG